MTRMDNTAGKPEVLSTHVTVTIPEITGIWAVAMGWLEQLTSCRQSRVASVTSGPNFRQNRKYDVTPSFSIFMMSVTHGMFDTQREARRHFSTQCWFFRLRVQRGVHLVTRDQNWDTLNLTVFACVADDKDFVMVETICGTLKSMAAVHAVDVYLMKPTRSD